MLGVSSQPPPEGQRLIPAVGWAVRVMSLALIAQPDQAAVWRGLMIGKLLAQFLDHVAWGALNYLIVDLPPGTDDAPLSLVQRIALDGAIVVSTPQDVALDDALRGLAMFQKLGVPILGMVENMSTFVCTCCGHAEPIFGFGGAGQMAARLGVPLLGTLPIIPAIRAGGDSDRPAAAERDTPQAAAFDQLAEAVLAVCVHARRKWGFNTRGTAWMPAYAPHIRVTLPLRAWWGAGAPPLRPHLDRRGVKDLRPSRSPKRNVSC